MDKLKRKLENMSLRKTLLFVSVISLSIVGVLSIATILTASDIRQEILDTRPITVTDYTVESSPEIANGFRIHPGKYSYGDLTDQNQLSYWAATALMIILPLLYVVTGSIAVAKVYYRWKLQTPIKVLKNGMAHISAQDLDFQILYKSDDELGKLCDLFEQMRSEVCKSNRKMWDMLQERKALTASVSHDLRTPITVIRGYLEYIDKSLSKETLTQDTLKMTVRNMTQAAERLERYVECVKDIQKIEDIEIRNGKIDLKKFISNISKDFKILAEQYGKQVEIWDLSETKQIVSDEEMLSKILENIFDNALRFAAEKIEIEVTEEKNNILFSVRDDGNGFTEDELKAATSFYYSSPINGGSFGIGLSICKILCGKLGGSLRLKNRPGSGAAVTIVIEKYPGLF